MPDFAHGRRSIALANGINLSRYLTEMSMSGGYDQTETTTFGSGVQSFVTGIRQGGEGSLGGNVETAESKVLRRFLRNAGGVDDNLLCLITESGAVGAVGVGVRCGLSEQEFSAAPADLWTVSIGVQGNRGLDDLVSLHPPQEETATGNGAAYDDLDTSDNGIVAYLHVMEATGQLDVVIEHSPDGTTWAPLVTIPPVTAGPAAVRQVVTGVNVESQVRASWTLAAATTTAPAATADFAVLFGRGKPGEDVS